MKNHESVIELFEHLKSVKQPPTEAIFDQVASRKSELIPLLLDEVESFANSPDLIENYSQDYIRHVLSLFILSYFRNKDAYPLVIKLISIPGHKVVQLTGEVFTEALGRILASVYDGDLKPIKSVIENPELNVWVRCAALDSLMVLWKENVIKRAEIVAYLSELMCTKLEKKSSYVWDSIALIAYDLHPGELQKLLSEAIRNKLISPIVLNEKNLQSCVKEDANEIIKNKHNVVDGYIKEPIKELTWWLYPDDEALEKGMAYAGVGVPLVDKKVIPGERSMPMGWRGNTPLVKQTEKVGRNDACPCGSGRKYKKCCGAN